MKRHHNIILLSLTIDLAILIAIVLYAPVWVNYPFAKKIIKERCENFINSRSAGAAVKIGDYRTNLLSFTEFDKVEVKGKGKLTVDKIFVAYTPQGLANGDFYGEILYGSARIAFKAHVGDGGRSIAAGVVTNWMDIEELNLKILQRFSKEFLGNVTMHGKILLNAELEYKDGNAVVKGTAGLKNIEVNLREYNLRVERLNGYIPFYEDFNGNRHSSVKAGRLTVERIAYKKFKFTGVKASVEYDNMAADFPAITCAFMKSAAEAKGRVWIDGKKIAYKADGVFNKIDFDDFSEIIANPDYGATGRGDGKIDIEGVGSDIKRCLITLSSMEPGGTIRAAALKKILGYLPQSDIKDKVKLALRENGDFRFTTGRFNFEKKKGIYEAYLFLDGDHKLTFNINIDEELIDDVLK